MIYAANVADSDLAVGNVSATALARGLGAAVDVVLGATVGLRGGSDFITIYFVSQFSRTKQQLVPRSGRADTKAVCTGQLERYNARRHDPRGEARY